MSRKELYNWQNFVDGIQEYDTNDDNVLLEMKQNIIDFLNKDIKMAESGKDHTMPFNDIFGTPAPENPKTRMIIPYGNPDIHKMKILMLDMFDKLYSEYIKNPNVSNVRSVVWANDKQVVKQQKKPQRWKEGDPIPTVDKEVGSPVVALTYTSKLGDQKERTVQFSFGKLLQKYFPNEMDWWQGDKKKNISGKQSFFTSNVETLDNIIDAVKFGDEETIRNEKPQDKVVIFSRHPIDVVRMSDFDLLNYSCHAQGGQFFRCAVEEAKRSANGGGVLFMVSKEKFDKAFPDAQLPQTGDLFNDPDRGIDDKFAAQATSRLRVRKVVDTSTNTEYAIPDTKMYGVNPEAFKKETLAYFANSQRNKFIDPETNEPIIPQRAQLERFGGSYEDGGDVNIGSNFALLMKTSYTQAGIYNEVEKNMEYVKLTNQLRQSSIIWMGDPAGERRNPADDEDEYCEEFEDQLNNAYDYGNRQLDYIEVPRLEFECDGEGNTYIYGMSAYVKVSIPESRFANNVLADIENVLKSHDYDNDYYQNTSLTWPNLPLKPELTTVNVKSNMVEIFITYHENEIESIRDIQSAFRDLSQFEGQMSYDDYKKEIELILENNGIIGQSAIASKQEQIQDLIASLEDTPFEVDEQSPRKINFEYAKELFVKDMAEYNLHVNLKSLIEEMKLEFQRIFTSRATTTIQQLQKQLPLFNDVKQQVNPKYLIPTIYDVKFAVVPTTFGTYDAPRKVVKVGYTFVVTLNATLSEEELALSAAFIKEIANDTETLDDIALQAVNNELQPYLKESKKAASSKLIKEGVGNNKTWRIKIK
jgi:hypothetical protein